METIISKIFQYGTLGLWTAYLIIQNYQLSKKFDELFKNQNKVLDEIAHKLNKLCDNFLK